MNLNFGAIRTACAAASLSFNATAQSPKSPTQEPAVVARTTTYLNRDSDLALLGGLTVTGEDFRLAALVHKPSNLENFLDATRAGLDLKIKDLTFNFGAGLREEELAFRRAAIGYESLRGDRLRLTYDAIPGDEQIAIEGRKRISDEVTVQGAIDDVATFRGRLLVEEGIYGGSVGVGRTNGSTIANLSLNSDSMWVLGTYQEHFDTRPGSGPVTGIRCVLGSIPKNRSDKAADTAATGGQTGAPGINDISLFPDQTAPIFIGEEPAFPQYGAATDAFLGKAAGSVVADVGWQQDRLLSARAVTRIGPLNSWLAVGAFYSLQSENPGIMLQGGINSNVFDSQIVFRQSEGEDFEIGALVGLTFRF